MRVLFPLAVAALAVACSSSQMRQAADLMESPIVPASDAIFNAVIYTNGQLAASPQTDADWDRLRQHSARLATAATTLKGLAPAEDPALWVTQSDALGEASAAAADAITGKSLDGLLQAGSRIYDTCTTCHAVYAKDL